MVAGVGCSSIAWRLRAQNESIADISPASNSNYAKIAASATIDGLDPKMKSQSSSTRKPAALLDGT